MKHDTRLFRMFKIKHRTVSVLIMMYLKFGVSNPRSNSVYWNYPLEDTTYDTNDTIFYLLYIRTNTAAAYLQGKIREIYHTFP